MRLCKFAARHFCRWPSCCLENENVTTSIQVSCKCLNPVGRRISCFYSDWSIVCKTILFSFFSVHIEDLYCFHYTSSLEEIPRTAGWTFFDLETEFQRMGVPNANWAMTNLNKDYQVRYIVSCFVSLFDQYQDPIDKKAWDAMISWKLCWWFIFIAVVWHLSSMPVCSNFGVDHRFGWQCQFSQQRTSSRFDLFT